MLTGLGFEVLYPTRFLEGEDVANNFLFPSDRSVTVLLDGVDRAHADECAPDYYHYPSTTNIPSSPLAIVSS